MQVSANSVNLIRGGNVIKQGDETPLTFQLNNDLGTLVNLTGATVTARMANSRIVVLEKEATVNEDNTITFNISSDDTTGHGQMRLEFVVTHEDGEMEIFPAQGYQEILITPSLGEIDAGEVSVITIEQFEKRVNESVTQANEAAEYATEQGDYAKSEADRLEGTDVSQLDRKIEDGLNSLSQEVAQKPNKDQVRLKGIPIGLNDADSDLLAAIQNKEGETSFNLLSEPRPDSVTIDSLNKNVFDLKQPITATITNILENGNFSSQWAAVDVDLATYKTENNTATFTATSSGGRIQTPVPTIQGHKYYLQADVKTDSNQVSIRLAGTPLKLHSGNGQFETLTLVVDGLVTANSTYRVQDTRTSGWTPVQVKNAMVFDLTEIYGAGKEPTAEEFEEVLATINNGEWFEGTVERKLPFDKEEIIVYDGVKLMSKPFDGEVISTKEKPLEGKTVVCFGDSITQGRNLEGEQYTTYMRDRLGAEIHNAGFGGTRMSYHAAPEYDAFGMYRLAESIASNDFSLQDSQINLVSSFQTNLNTLKSIDFSTVDYITLMYGANDFGQGVALDDENNPMYERTYITAGRLVLDTLLTAYPHLKIILISPTWRSRQSSGDGKDADNFPNGHDLYLRDYATALSELADEFHVEYLDMLKNGFVNMYNHEHYLRDGLHPNENGAELFGSRISGFLEGL